MMLNVDRAAEKVAEIVQRIADKAPYGGFETEECIDEITVHLMTCIDTVNEEWVRFWDADRLRILDEVTAREYMQLVTERTARLLKYRKD